MKWYEIAGFILILPIGLYLNEVVRHRRSLLEDASNLWKRITRKRDQNSKGGNYGY